MNQPITTKVKFQNNLRYYFFDLYIFEYVKLGHTIAAWIIACYLSFSLGIFSRQVVKTGANPAIDVSHIQWSVIVSSLLIGLAFFGPTIRLIFKQVDHFFSINERMKKEKKKIEPFNILHLFFSFSYGYFLQLFVGNIFHYLQA